MRYQTKLDDYFDTKTGKLRDKKEISKRIGRYTNLIAIERKKEEEAKRREQEFIMISDAIIRALIPADFQYESTAKNSFFKTVFEDFRKIIKAEKINWERVKHILVKSLDNGDFLYYIKVRYGFFIYKITFIVDERGHYKVSIEKETERWGFDLMTKILLALGRELLNDGEKQ